MKTTICIALLYTLSYLGLCQDFIQPSEVIMNDAARRELEEWKAVNATNKPPGPGASLEAISLWRMNRVPGAKFLYNKTNPLPVIKEVPGKFWFKTNGWGEVVSNGVTYSYIVIKTNYGPKTIATITIKQTEEQMEATREAWKARDLEQGINQDVRAKEEKIKEDARALFIGMTAQDVIDFMGPPSMAIARFVTGVNQYSEREINFTEYAGHEPNSTMIYTPYKKFNLHKCQGPYQTLEVAFNEKGILWYMTWH